MGLTPPEPVQKLQNSLHAKAKGSPGYRFYALYDKVYRKDVLAFAYDCCKSNKGSAGVDGQTFEDIKEYGLDRWLGELQGAPISPLLSNLYMRRFVLGWRSMGHQRRLKAFVVNYADDLVICCRGDAEEALNAMREMMSRLKLTVNETKTRVCRAPQETFDFLGYTFGRLWSPRTGRPYPGVCPSKKRIQRLCDRVTEMTDRRGTHRSVEEVVTGLNRLVEGWANYFSLGSVGKAYRIADVHAGGRLRMWLQAKHKASCVGKKRFTDTATARLLGLVRLQGRKGSLPWATA